MACFSPHLKFVAIHILTWFDCPLKWVWLVVVGTGYGIKILADLKKNHFISKPNNYFHVSLKGGVAARIFPTSYAATVNQTHVSSVAPHRGILIKEEKGRFTH